MTAKRRFQLEGPDSSTPRFGPVTKNDDADLPFITRQLDVLSAGTLHVLTENNEEVTLPEAPGPWSFPIRVRRVFEDSTADDIIAYY